MASREMIDVLQRLRELDETNPNVHTDALENTEKMNPPVEEAKKKMVKDPKTGKMVPDYAIDGKGKDDLKKEEVKESITISADSPEDLPVIAQLMKLAGMQTVTPDMMPDADNVPMMKSDDDINANNDDDCGCEDDDNAVVTKTDTGVDFDLDQDGEPDMSYSEQERLAHLAGIENEDEDTKEGFANSMGDEKEEPTYKGYDPEYAKDAGAATRKTKQVPANSGDNPLEAIENNLRSAYDTFKEELWNELSDGKEHTSEGRGKVMAGRGRGKDKLMAGRGRGKSEDVKTSEGRGRGKAKAKK